MFKAGLPALGSDCSTFPMDESEESPISGLQLTRRWLHRADINTHYGGASAAAFHRTSLFTRMETNPRAPRTLKA